MFQSLRATFLCTCLGVAYCAASTAAQHLDIQVQSVSEKLSTGFGDFDNGSFTVGARVFSRLFNSLYAVNNPGFSAVGTTTGALPPGSAALPGGTDLLWDFLPMKVNGFSSNLLYWDGNGSTIDDVSFGPTPTSSYSLSLFGKNNAQATANGSDQLIPGQIVATTASDGFVHEHRYFFLDNDTDPNNATVAAEGIYLVALRLRMEGLDRSDPLYVVWGTPTPVSTIAASVQAASDWVQTQVDQLSPNFSADFDGDLDVDGADFLVWQRGFAQFGSDALQIAGDADFDAAVGVADLMLWQQQYGLSAATFPGATSGSLLISETPEPRSQLLAGSCLALGLLRRSRGTRI